MRRTPAHSAKIIRRLDEAAAEMIVPHAVHDGTPRQRIVRVDEPPRQRGAARAFVALVVDLELRRQISHTAKRAG